MRPHSKNLNRPKPGSDITVGAIEPQWAIEAIKSNLKDKPRDLCLFVLGINTAFRAGELLSLNVGDVAHLKPGQNLRIKQSKTNKYRIVRLNRKAFECIQLWLRAHPSPTPEAPLFRSRSGNALLVSTVNNMVKQWCQEVGLPGNYGSHSLRKTWGYHHYHNNAKAAPARLLSLLQKAFGHARPAQTLDYLCIHEEEVLELYTQLEL